ncbi:hypothetical protein KDW_34400 [Dictyobacter vulcani]|uniref:Uncharacterized protein n=1 Tax=Dictyobacter vulcani TaxID=2607529 RepID=A0A5J4KHP6_9CHLR|nr:hypothetical protein KDW_34400 [Dictyobacter vulcani]
MEKISAYAGAQSSDTSLINLIFPHKARQQARTSLQLYIGTYLAVVVYEGDSS